jgi:vacuolar-type H+-ATPase subunit F/Vma7
VNTNSTFATKQDNKSHLLSYVNLFFPEDLNNYINSNKSYFDKLFEGFQFKKERPIHILIGGAGIGVFELPLLKYLIDEGYKLRILAYDHSLVSRKLFLQVLNKLLFSTENFTRKTFCAFIENNYDNNLIDDDIYKNEIVEVIYKCKSLELDSNPDNEREDDNSERVNVKDTGINYKTSDFLRQDIPSNWDNFDIIIFSSLLHHLSYWRSLIAYCNNFLKSSDSQTGFFLINELGGDNLLINGDPNRWREEAYDKNKEDLYLLFSSFYGDGYSIISDNKELSATNLSILKHFFSYMNSDCSDENKIDLLTLESTQNIAFFDNMVKENLFSSINRSNEYKNKRDKIKINFARKIDFNCNIKWYRFNKIVDNNPFLQHFDIIRDNNNPVNTQILKSYISEILDMLYSQRSLYSFHILNSDNKLEKAEKIDNYLKSILNLFRRFILLSKNGYRANLTIAENENEKKHYYINCDYGDEEERKNKLQTYNSYFDLLTQYGKIQNKEYNNNDALFEKYKSYYTSQICFVLNFKDTDNWQEIKTSNIYQIYITKFTDNYTVSNKYIKLFELFTENKKNISKTLEFGNEAFGNSILIIIPFFSDSFIFGASGKQFIASLNIIIEKEYFNPKIIDDIVSFYSWIINKFIVFSELNKYLDFKKSIKSIHRESIKASKAGIMSRNMSHNLGSHVMTYLKQKLSSVESIVEQEALVELVKTTSLEQVPQLDYNTAKNIELPFLVGLGRFINYLQERQDYVATVATDYIPAKTTISFKDFIYDELKPDLRYERHVGDNGIIGKKPDNILLNYIAYSEEYKHADNIVIKFRDFDGKIPKDSTEELSLDELRKFEVALPGGTVGRQAFFSVMENIIRNTAKHGDKKHKMEITIDLLENAENLDDIKDGNGNNIEFDEKNTKIEEALKISYTKEQYKVFPSLYNQCRNKYYILTITANKPNNFDVIEALREGIISSYIGDDKDNYKGIKEMRISSAWMRGYKMDTDINMEVEPPALAVRGVNYNEATRKCEIQYVICLPKPRKIAFVTNKEIDDDFNNKIDEFGWKIFSEDNREIADYDIIIIDEQVKDSIKDEIKQNAHARIYECADLSITDIKTKVNEIESLKGENKEDERDKKRSQLIADYYKKWICQKFELEKEKLPWLIVCDEKTKDKENSLRELEKVECVGSNTDAIRNNVIKDNCILYSTHYEGALTINASHEKEGYALKEAGFIEGISGANSTDRLIRKNEWSPDWQYKHILAGLTNVAIIDERIFSYVSSKKIESRDIEKIEELKQYINDYDKSSWQKNRTFVEASKVIESDFSKILQNLSLDEESKINYSKELMNYIIGDIDSRPQMPTLEYNKERMQKFYEKGVWVYNMDFIEYSNDKKIRIVGYDIGNIRNKLADYTKATIGEVGVIKQNEEKEIEIEFKNSNTFHFILIHQSLLDKIYDFFDLKEPENKLNFTNKLHEKFYRNKDHIDYQNLNKNDYTLPQFIIHSGRSKPSLKDMPQRQPFLQFSAVENAVKDCKYTLSELLYSAHYEKNSNNNEN